MLPRPVFRSVLLTFASTASILCVFSACENSIPGPPSETVIYRIHRPPTSVNANVPGDTAAAGTGSTGTTGSGGMNSGPSTTPIQCLPARAADEEKLPARSSATSGDVAPPAQPVSVTDLFTKMNGQCGSCHAVGSLNGWEVTLETFSTKFTDDVLARMKSDNLDLVMPPTRMLLSQRGANDPIVTLVKQLEDWIAAGRPSNFYYPPSTVAGDKRWVLSETLGKSLTNIGNCVPNRLETSAEAQKLDEFFAKASELPKRLEDTDLTSLDSEVLARQGVVAFSPAYPLWSDDAKKIRHVRVPVGKSIVYNPATKNFDIPPNTRFYKTFLKKVIDTQGKVSFRKIETRIIVSRQNEPGPGGRPEPKALFGTYKWSQDEWSATLQELEFKDHTKFADDLITYPTDEVKAAALAAIQPPPADLNEQKKSVQRHYAIPSTNRCEQCHEGSPNASFVLGFTPLQIARRPLGEGGTIEAPGEDELTQLQRLIDYGVITGMENVVAPKLEDSQGARKPRNKYELEAQGYLLGNCSHCHNPNGYPTLNFTELKKLNFWPDENPNDGDHIGGGIFQFPLDRMSDRTFRYDTLGKQVQIPYISPSLVDVKMEVDPIFTVNRKYIYPGFSGGSKPPRSVRLITKAGTLSNNNDNQREPVDAPWRSLIYRNVDAPFTYSEDKAIFNHMPLHTSGFDCRAPKIVGNWMVSIPARPHGSYTIPQTVKESATIPDPAVTIEFDVPAEDCSAPLFQIRNPNSKILTVPFLNFANIGDGPYTCETCTGKLCLDPEVKDFYGFSTRAQPYREVRSDTTDSLRFDLISQSVKDFSYQAAGAQAEERLKVYQAGERYNYCPDTTDIIDPEVNNMVVGGKLLVVPREQLPEPPQQQQLGIPSHTHFIVTDTTQKPGPWDPRQLSWDKVLPSDPFASPPPSSLANVDGEQLATLKLLKSVRISAEFRALVTTDLPYGVWDAKWQSPQDVCDFSTTKLVRDFTSQPDSLQWIRERATFVGGPQKKPGGKLVYEQSLGGAVFNMICINCHGREADSKGLLADQIITLTGGLTSVADLRDGLFGPAGHAGDNRDRVFGSVAATMGITPDDVGARYMAWMALGGTTATIPPSILQLVSATPVLGNSRTLTTEASPNMLQTAMELCKYVLPFGGSIGSDAVFSETRSGFVNSRYFPLFDDNGDAEFWQRICTADNPPPVRVVQLKQTKDGDGILGKGMLVQESIYDPAAYPPLVPVGTHSGTVSLGGIEPGNRLPWCIDPQNGKFTGNFTEAEKLANITAYAQANPTGGQPLPLCPSQLFNAVPVMGGVSVSPEWLLERKLTWARRGAINAGLAVFLYLDGIARGTIIPKVNYDQCAVPKKAAN